MAKSIAVMPGDVVTMDVYAKYVDRTNTAQWSGALATLMGQILAGNASYVTEGGAYSSSFTAFPAAYSVNNSGSTGTGPKAYLNYLIFDKKFNLISQNFQRVSTLACETGQTNPVEGKAHERLFFDNITIKEPGYMYIYLSNENGTPVEVFFDDFKVTHTKSPVIQAEDYYPFGLVASSYQRENLLEQNYLYNGKELQDELNLGWLDYGARMYMPEIGRWGVVDPAADKYLDFSPYVYCANNPIIYIDPTGMYIEESSMNEWLKHKNGVTSRRDGLQEKANNLTEKAEAKGWSTEKLERKMGNLNERIGSLNNSLSTMGTLESSSQGYSLSHTTPNEFGGITLTSIGDKNTIDIKFGAGNTGNFVHEVTHAGQFETGEVAFFTDEGQSVLQDVYDEVSAYKAQFAFDPKSVSGLPSTSVAKSFGSITTSWVQGINGGTVYVPGTKQNTGVGPLNINSTKADLVNAYPHDKDIKMYPASFSIRNQSNIYYKK